MTFAAAASPLEPQLLTALDSIIRDVVAPNAQRVDAEASFPEHAIAALAEAGLLGVLSSAEVGGLGARLGAAALVVERLARECGSSAMVVTMHYCGVAVLESHASPEIRREAAAGRHLSTLAFSDSAAIAVIIDSLDPSATVSLAPGQASTVVATSL